MPKHLPSKLTYSGMLDPDRILGFKAAPPWLPCDVLRWPGESFDAFLERVRASSNETRAAEVSIELIMRSDS